MSGSLRLASDPGSGTASATARVAWLILALALAVRLGAIALGSPYEPVGDAADYDRHAVAIAAGDGYPESAIVAGGGASAFRPPAYPYVLGAVYALSGDSVTAGLVLQALLGTIVVALVGLVARQVWGRRVALWAMGVAAVYPPLVVLGAALLSEPMFVALELGAIAAAIEHRRSPHGYRWAVACGLLVGLATLTRVNGAILLLPLAIYIGAARPRPSAASVAPALVAVAVAALTLVPWTVRNASAFGEFIPFTTQDSFALARNYNDLARTDQVAPSTPHDSREMLAVVRDPAVDESEAADELGARARSYMREHPGYVATTVARNLARSLHLDGPELGEAAAEGVGIEPALARIGILGFYAFALVALLGAVLPAARRAPWALWAAPVLAMLPALLIAAGRTRYRAPIEPAVVMLAALALSWAWARVRAGPRPDALARSRGSA